MIGQLARNERQLALFILGALAVVGLAMTGPGRDDLLGPQGAIVLLAAVAGILGVISGKFDPEPKKDRLDRSGMYCRDT